MTADINRETIIMETILQNTNIMPQIHTTSTIHYFPLIWGQFFNQVIGKKRINQY